VRLSTLTLLLALAALACLALAGPGYRLEIWTFSTGFSIMRWAAIAGLAAAGLAVVLLVIPRTRSGAVPALIVALGIGLITAWVPWQGLQTARSVPPIHDITTDTEDPPAFVDIVALRIDAPNPPEYLDDESAEQQAEAYPWIEPFFTEVPIEQVFEFALATADAMGWEIHAAEPGEGRIEATDTTFWFGFKDDVVIRISAENSGSRVDVRSKSRIGRSDVGANARRIEAYLERLDRALPES